jgi:hypothetical protein
MGFREFREVSDGEWEVISPFLPSMSRVGRPRADDRMFLNGIQVVVGGVSMALIRLLGGDGCMGEYI